MHLPVSRIWNSPRVAQRCDTLLEHPVIVSLATEWVIACTPGVIELERPPFLHHITLSFHKTEVLPSQHNGSAWTILLTPTHREGERQPAPWTYHRLIARRRLPDGQSAEERWQTDASVAYYMYMQRFALAYQPCAITAWGSYLPGR